MENIVILNRNILTYMNRYDSYPEYPFALIRFFNPKSGYKLDFPKNCVAHLEIECDDVSNTKMESAERYVFFSEYDAERILDFVEKHKDNFQELICACEAGISRSAGCGAALEKIYLDDDTIFYSTKYYPNNLIKTTILNAYLKRQRKTG